MFFSIVFITTHNKRQVEKYIYVDFDLLFKKNIMINVNYIGIGIHIIYNNVMKYTWISDRLIN